MNLRACASCLWRVSSWPQYGQRRHPSGYVRLHAEQTTLFGSGIANRRALYTSVPCPPTRPDARRCARSSSSRREALRATAGTMRGPRSCCGGSRAHRRCGARWRAAHFLRESRGISEPLHGHSYKVEAELAARGGGVDGDAIAVDFVSAKRKLEALAKRLDYGCINDVAPFTDINPSAENIARWFHGELAAAVADENAVVRAVTVWEGPVNSVTFRPAS